MPSSTPAETISNVRNIKTVCQIKRFVGEEITWPNCSEEVINSFGDAAITEGEVAEAFQMATLKKLPILYLVQDNEWDISAHASETRAVDATHYAKGFG